MEQAERLIRRGLEFYRRNDLHHAELCYRQALAMDQTAADAWHLLGIIADAAGKSDDAIQLIRHALKLRSDRADFLNNLGTIHEPRGDYLLAERAFREAIRISPNYATAHNNLGEVMKDLGRVGDSMVCYREALKHDPAFYQASSNLLMGFNYDPDVSREEVFAAHRKWGESIQRSAVPLSPPKPRVHIPEVLRIGYVSPDLRQHAVARFLEPILASHDRDRFQAYLYAECPLVDAVSHRLKGYACGWRSTRGRSALQVAENVLHDEIDILVDLAGHTRNNRLDVFAHHPAQIQVTYLGYPNTTGLSAIDYRITDQVLNPPNEPSWATEELIRLPGHAYCFQPPADAPDVGPPPSLRVGTVNFGSYHPPIKLNEEVLKLWAQVLSAVPGSRLLMFRNSFNQILQNELMERMARSQIPLDRVEFRCPTDKSESYLPLFNEIDIILDSFPFTGHTMTCEALWMGVPVVTLSGSRPSGRLSASVLTAVGLQDLIASTPREYVTCAADWAKASDRRAALRTKLRSLMLEHLCDGSKFTRRLEETYFQLWQKRYNRHACLG